MPYAIWKSQIHSWLRFAVRNLQQPVGRVGNPLDIANMVLYLCSDKAGFITGENIYIDGEVIVKP